MQQLIRQVANGTKFRAFALYALTLIATVITFCFILGLGEGLRAPPAGVLPGDKAVISQTGSHTILHLLLALIVVIVSCRIVGGIFRYLGQPPVIGEVLAGILIGPSCLGRLVPGAIESLLPHDAMSILGMFAQLGVILYMFLVGLDFDAAVLRHKSHSAIAISHASIIVPFLLGSGLALALYPILSNDGVSFRSFALFLGVSMSVTAFPVLARILTDQNMHRSSLGLMALACAAVDDVTAWCLLALVVGIAQAEVSAAITVTVLTLFYISTMFFVVRPLLLGLKPAGSPISKDVVAVVLTTVFGAACLTEYIGIHAIFGAFLFGAVIPKESAVADELRKKLEDVVTIVLLPLFFAFAGLRTQIGLISGLENWILCGVIILVASLGKFGGTTVAARLCRIDWRNSSALGILMNTRGLMELIVLNIGLDLGLISAQLYALMVVMAIVTTMMTTPILRLVLRKSLLGGGSDSANSVPDVAVASLDPRRLSDRRELVNDFDLSLTEPKSLTTPYPFEMSDEPYCQQP